MSRRSLKSRGGLFWQEIPATNNELRFHFFICVIRFPSSRLQLLPPLLFTCTASNRFNPRAICISILIIVPSIFLEVIISVMRHTIFPAFAACCYSFVYAELSVFGSMEIINFAYALRFRWGKRRIYRKLNSRREIAYC